MPLGELPRRRCRSAAGGLRHRLPRLALRRWISAREQGVKAGLFRPISLWPFPSQALAEAAKPAAMVMVVELSTGQMVEDVKLALNGAKPVEFYGRVGGNAPSAEECKAELFARMEVQV